jgi:hypothetical protein
MGYLTTLTIYNDGIHIIKDKAQDFADRVYDAAVTPSRATDIELGSFGNLIRVQKPRHADDHTVYVHMGNAVCEMNVYSDDTLKTMAQSPKFFKKMLAEMKKQVKMLSKQLKEYEDDHGSDVDR